MSDPERYHGEEAANGPGVANSLAKPGDAWGSSTPWDQDATRPCVLVVEDHAINRRVVRLILDPLGLDVVEAGDGQEGLTLFQQQHFDLVLMDMLMPVMDGVAATMAIREFEQSNGRQRTPVIMLTANSSSDHQSMSLKGGADNHIVKPIDREQLVEAVLEALNLSADAALA